MADHMIKVPKEFIEQLRLLTIDDDATADNFNELYATLINNDAFLKEKVDKVINDQSNSVYLQDIEPTNTTQNTLWYAIGSESNFSIGGGIEVLNAETSDTPPIDSPLWFQTT